MYKGASRQKILSQNTPIFKDFQNLMKDMERVDANLSVQSVPDKVILLLGETKAGKTTLLYYLLGKKLIRYLNDKLCIYHMKPQAKLFNAQIGNEYESATVYPNIPTELDEDRVLIIDMPGFSDTRYICRLLNIYIIREVIKKIRSVHVALVVPFETLEAEHLASTIERNCLLLNDQLVSTPGCISFILTKIEDRKEDLDAFKNFMELLKQEKLDEPLGTIMATLQNAKTYIFENTDPKVQLGVAMKRRIVSENRFFQTDEKPDNLLSQSYADIIAGSQNPQEFSNFVIDLLDGVEETLTLLVGFFAKILQLHHIPQFKVIYALQELEQDELMEGITEAAKQIHVGGISTLQIRFNEKHQPVGQEEGLLNLAKKFYRPQKDEVDMDVQVFKGILESFIEWSGLLVAEQSRISLYLRKSIHELFKFCSKVSKTISHIKQPQIIAKFESFCKSPEILNAIEDYNSIQKKNDLIVRIAQSEYGAGKLSEFQEFKQILYSVSPNFTFGDFQEVIEKVKVSTHNKILNKKMLATLETTKQVQPPVHRAQQTKPITISAITRDTINTIKSIPLQYTHLKTLFAFILHFKVDFQKANNDLHTEFGMALFHKTAQLLEKLQLYEESILFYLSIPSEIQAELLIEVGLAFGEISKEFIQDILLPYYSCWNPSFQMVERLFNYLSLNIYDPTLLYENQLILAEMVDRMHNADYDKLPFLKRFQLGLVESIYTEGKQRNHILDRARRNEDRLKRSKIIGLSKEFSTLRLC